MEARGDAVVATRVYRGILSQSLFSRCRMAPSDSEAFDARASRCGGLTAALLGSARLLLEIEASPLLLRPVVLDGRVRWLDPPGRRGSCWRLGSR